MGLSLNIRNILYIQFLFVYFVGKHKYQSNVNVNVILFNICLQGEVVGEFSPKSLRDHFTKSLDILIQLPENDGDASAVENLKEQLHNCAAHCTIVVVPGEMLQLTVPYVDESETNIDFASLIRFLEVAENEKRVVSFKVISKNLEEIFKHLVESSPSSVASIDRHHNGVSILMNDYNNGEAQKPHYYTEESPPIELYSADNEKFSERSEWVVIRNLFWKRLLHFKRNYRLILCVLVLPTIFEIIAMDFMTTRPPGEYDINLKLSTDLYPASTTFKT